MGNRNLKRKRALFVGAAAATAALPLAQGAAAQTVTVDPGGGVVMPLSGSYNCLNLGGPGSDSVCTKAEIWESYNGVFGNVWGYSYPLSTIWAQANIYKNSFNTSFFRDMRSCANATECTYPFDFPDCGNGTYYLVGFSWKSGSNVQPEAHAQTTVI